LISLVGNGHAFVERSVGSPMQNHWLRAVTINRLSGVWLFLFLRHSPDQESSWLERFPRGHVKRYGAKIDSDDDAVSKCRLLNIAVSAQNPVVGHLRITRGPHVRAGIPVAPHKPLFL